MLIFLKNLAIVMVGIGISLFLTYGLNTLDEADKDVVVPDNIQEEVLEEVAEELVVEGVVKEVPKNKTEIIIKGNTEVNVEVDTNEDILNVIDSIVSILPVNESSLDVSVVNSIARNALVNIICTSQQGGLLQPITGSGMIIDRRGVILTNAHIGQYFLLKDYLIKDFLTCNIRVGSPAVNTYKGELLYISPTWVRNNYQKISSSNPKGTGEDDFALILITGSTKEGVSLPSEHPSVGLEITAELPRVNDSVLVAGYPAGFLSGQTIQKELYAVSTVAKVMEVFTFSENSLDLFSVGGNIAAQKGSSGGGILNFKGNLLGIVVTATDATQTNDRDLRAITLFHVNESMKKNSGTDLNNYLLGNLSSKSLQFREVIAPELKDLLLSALN